MCLKCHLRLDDNDILEQLTRALKEKNYELFNSTSISHIILAGHGINGFKTKEIAINLLIDFNKWTKKNNKYTFGDDFDTIIKELSIKNYTKEELLNEMDIKNCC